MEIKRVACIGAGLIGRGWATVFSSNDYKVTLQDLKVEIIEDALNTIESNLRFLEANQLLKFGNVNSALKGLSTTTSVAEAVVSADYVQESVPDDYVVKRSVFKEMDTAASDHVILANSSSGLLMTEIQKAVTRPERCVLAHPILPAHLIPLVEIVGGRQTSPEFCQVVFDLMQKLGKIPILLKKEVPGYIVNRFQAALLREAIDLVDKGVAIPEDIDKAFCKGTGLRDPILGPFLRIHLAGDGIENFIKNYSHSYSYRWEDMTTWTSIPESAVEKVLAGVHGMEDIRQRDIEDIKAWRDKKLVAILRILSENGN